MNALLLLVSLSASPTLTWGADAQGGAPYVFQDPMDPNRLTGFEVELASMLAQRMGRQARPVHGPWDRLLELLAKKKGEWLDRIEIAKFKVKMISEMEKTALEEAERTKDRTVDPEKRAYRLSRLVTLENSKVDSALSEVLWL